MADYSLPLVDTVAQLPEPCVAVTAAPSVGFWVFKGSQRMGQEKTRRGLQRCEMQILSITNFYPVYTIMVGRCLIAVPQKSESDWWLQDTPGKMEVI